MLNSTTDQTDNPSPELDIVDQNTFTWVPFYQEMCPQLLEYSPADLIKLIKQVIEEPNQVGINDRDAEGNVFPLADIDPYTFLSFLNKMGNAKRLAVLARLRQSLNIASPTPTDLDGLPTSQAQSVWMFGYAYKRQPNDINQLRTLYRKVESNSITAEPFEQALTIYRVGPAKLTEALFCQKPTEYLPVNSQTKAWLKKRNLPFRYETFAEYQHLLEQVRQHDPRPFYFISREAYLENNTPAMSSQNKYYCVGITYNEYGGEQLSRFIEDGLWENGHGPDKEKFAKIVKSVPVGAKLAAKSNNRHTGSLAVKAIGEVTDNKNDGQTLFVNWLKTEFSVPDKGAAYSSTIREVTKPEDIKLIFPTHDTDLMPEPSSQYPKNIILYGPPGTGKTYETVDLAVEIIDGHKSNDHQVNKIRFDVLRQGGQIEFVTFHQNYTYEDFVMGLKPDTNGKGLKFQRSYGIFYRMTKRAQQAYEDSGNKEQLKAFDEVITELGNRLQRGPIQLNLATSGSMALRKVDATVHAETSAGDPITLSLKNLREYYGKKQYLGGHQSYYRPTLKFLEELGFQSNTLQLPSKYVLIIDEINRANMSRVFGELITLLEDDKRLGADMELTVTLPSGEPFTVPPNLYLIGTMNTADKSLSLLDIALRRRFEFIGKYPNYEVLDNPAKDLLERLNKAILAYPKPADLLIGHAYFIGKDSAQLPAVFNNRVIPLLMEYFNGRVDQVETLLEKAGIKSERHPLTNQLTVIHVA